MAAPTQPTRLVPLHVVMDLHATLARLRTARLVDPKHVMPRDTWHSLCEVCNATRRFEWLLDQLPPARPRPHTEPR